MNTLTEQHDLLVQQLQVIGRRIDRHLDNHDRRLFMIAVQHRAQLMYRLAQIEGSAADSPASV